MNTTKIPKDVEDALQELVTVHKFVRKILTLQEDNYVCNKIGLYYEHAANGDFAPENKQALMESSWNDDANIRYGAFSIRGFTAELVTLAVWNANNKNTRYTFPNKDDKQKQLAGWDLEAFNAQWNKTYPVEVKRVNDINAFEIRHEQWFKYPKLDRFVVCNVENMTIIQVSYGEFKEFCKDRIYTGTKEILQNKQRLLVIKLFIPK